MNTHKHIHKYTYTQNKHRHFFSEKNFMFIKKSLNFWKLSTGIKTLNYTYFFRNKQHELLILVIKCEKTENFPTKKVVII